MITEDSEYGCWIRLQKETSNILALLDLVTSYYGALKGGSIDQRKSPFELSLFAKFITEVGDVSAPDRLEGNHGFGISRNVSSPNV